ncbi:MAG: glycosyltransferase family 4 protein [Methanotrichaceae archaeon]|nr:glycosyltransferase family 4 protein [Methanotrichaceae archaeon]
MYDYLRSRYINVVNITWQTKPHNTKLQFFLNSVEQNLSLLKLLRQLEGRTIIIEDISSSSDLFLFNLIAKYAKRILGKEIRIMPIVHHVYAPLKKGKLEKRLKFNEERIFLNSADGIIVSSEFTKSSVESLINHPMDIVLAYPGLNVSSTRKTYENVKDRENLHLLFVGYITPRKGVDTLIDSFRILVMDYGIHNLILDLVGDTTRDPSFFREILRNCEAIGIMEKVRIHGRVASDELEKLYAMADAFVFPSLWEGFGMVLIEAMYNCLPIVATNAGAIPFLVKDGQNGILVPVKDSEKLAKSIKKLIESPELRRSFGGSNYQLALEFNWDKSFLKIESFIDKSFDL